MNIGFNITLAKAILVECYWQKNDLIELKSEWVIMCIYKYIQVIEYSLSKQTITKYCKNYPKRETPKYYN